jgi:hypothetical protein
MKTKLIMLFLMCIPLVVFPDDLADKQAEAAHDEFMSYVYMGSGFLAIILWAVYTSVKGNKNEKNKK